MIFSLKKETPPLKIIYSLANNHSMDYGWEALRQTLTKAEEGNDLAVGVGREQAEAQQPLIIEFDGKAIAILACCERQFGIAKYGKLGCAVMGDWLYGAIRHNKRNVDYVIVSCHAAVEDFPWPSPRLRFFYRALAECGADVIHGHHAHVPQPVEQYGDSLIAYGLGNFVVPQENWKHVPNALWSIGLKLSVSKGKIEYKKVFIDSMFDVTKSKFYPTISESNASFLAYDTEINSIMKDDALFSSLWHEISMLLYSVYGKEYLFQDQRFSRSKNFLRKIMNAFKNNTIGFNRNAMLSYCMLACDSHRELIESAIAIEEKIIPDLRTERSRLLLQKYMGYMI